MSAPLNLRRMSRTTAASLCQVARHRVALPFAWLDGEWQLHFRPLEAERSGLVNLDIDWGGSDVVARVDAAWLTQVGRQVLGVDELRQLPAELQPLVIEAAFEGLAGLIESATRKRFCLRDGLATRDVSTAGRHGVGFMLDDGEASASGELWFDDAGLGYLASAVRQLQPSDAGQDWGALPVPVRFCAGWTDVPLSSLRQLKRRDVVLLDESWVGSELDRIVVRMGRLGASASINGRHITLMEEPGEIMDELDEQSVDDSAGFADLPVRLHFDLGERQLTLSELMVIGPGHVFDRGRELRRAVIIRANGKAIGEGGLVDIYGQIGVSVLSLTPPERE